MKAEQEDSRNVFALMGNLLGCQVATEADVWALMCKGVAVGTYKRLAKNLQLERGMVVSVATLRRRSKPRGRLTPAESDRLLRILRTHCKAVQLFGDPALAQEWMRRPAPLLPGEQPISPQALAVFDSGARLLEALMDRTAHGML
jgi:putative toxin-antitoxin system antitoxin component (TIGR02293 family)